MTSQITSLTAVYLTVYSGVDHRKHQSSASFTFVRGIHRWPVNSPHKRSITRNMFPFDDAIMTVTVTFASQYTCVFVHVIAMPQCTTPLITCCDAFYYLLIGQITPAAIRLFRLLQYYHNDLSQIVYHSISYWWCLHNVANTMVVDASPCHRGIGH